MSQPPGQPWYPGQPDPNQPQYGGYSGGSGYPPPDQPYGGSDPGYGPQQPYSGGPSYPHEGSGYPPESYTTEPPYSGQPYSGGGGYGAPQQPAYDPGYQQGYQQPGYPQSSPPYQPGGGFAPAPAPRRGRGGLIAMIVGGVVLLLLLCGVGGVVLLNRESDNTGGTAGPTSGPTSTGGTTATPSPTPTVKPDYPATITLPQQVAGLTKVDDPQLKATADETAVKIKNSTNADSAVAGFYAPGSDRTRIVGIIGATARISNPASELDEAFNSAGTVSGVRDVNAGPLGGVMKCGNTSTGGVALTMCGWADGGSLALGLFFNRSLDDSAVLLRQIRSEILRRG